MEIVKVGGDESLHMRGIRMLVENDINKTETTHKKNGGARGVVVIIIGNGHGDTSSNPGRD